MDQMANASSALHALAILKLLARHASPLPASAIARDLGLPRSSVYHLLAILRAEGFVAHLAEEHRYGLGVSTFELGSAYARQTPLRWVAGPVLARLVDRTTHSGHFAILHGHDVLYVIEERAAGRPALVTDVDVRLPAHLTASGRAILAELPAQQLRALYPPRGPLAQRNGTGPRSASALRRVLVDARRDGYAQEDGSVTVGFSSIGAAVLDHGGHPVAAVALTFPGDVVDLPARDRLAAAVRDAAREVSRRIRGRG